jgi:hypothetical protein
MDPSEHLHDALTGQHLTFVRTAKDTEGALLQLEVRLDPGGWVRGTSTFARTSASKSSPGL